MSTTKEYTQYMLKLHTKAPDFTLRDQDSKLRSLSDLEGEYVLLYFYPKDNTAGCTTEACALRDAWDEYAKHGVTIIGVSRDSTESHQKFRKDHNLPFDLLSDESGEMIKKYDANGTLTTQRVSYLIDPKGIIVATYPQVDPAIHAVEVLKDIDAIMKK